MGLFDSMRRKKEERRRAEEAKNYEQALVSWQKEEEELRDLLDSAQDFRGLSAEELAGQEISVPILLKKGERVFVAIEGACLVEPRRGRGQYSGGYSGFSFRLVKGVRYHVGGSKGRYTPGEEMPTIIDTGTATITSHRVVFQGPKQSREWSYSKLIGYQHDSQHPITMLQVSNRQKASGLLYTQESAEQIHFLLALATSLFNDSLGALITSIKGELADHEATKPTSTTGSPRLPPG
ncbi:MAG: hypothetical protein KY429_10685 [Actinobacteria bacterium]|nr:hypothetical protein [Actinomycetota bacterium]